MGYQPIPLRDGVNLVNESFLRPNKRVQAEQLNRMKFLLTLADLDKVLDKGADAICLSREFLI